MTAPTRPPAWGPLAVLIAVAIPTWWALAYLQRTLGVSTETIRLPQFAAAIGCLTAWLIWRHRIDLGTATRPLRWVPLILALVGAGLPVLIMQFVFDSFAEPPRRLVFATLPVPFALVALGYLSGALAQEFAWRGFAQPMLESRMSPGRAAAMTGSLFGLSQVVYLNHSDGRVLALLMVAAVNVSVVAAAITQGLHWRARTLAAGAFHTLLALGLLVAFGGDRSVATATDTTLSYAAILALGTLLPVLLTFPRLVSSSDQTERVGADGAGR